MISTAILPRKCGGIDYRRVVVVVVSSILNGTWNLEKCGSVVQSSQHLSSKVPIFGHHYCCFGWKKP
jgi:hypothetical protein